MYSSSILGISVAGANHLRSKCRIVKACIGRLCTTTCIPRIDATARQEICMLVMSMLVMSMPVMNIYSYRAQTAEAKSVVNSA